MRLQILTLVFLTTALGGCGEISYKMGGGPDQLKADQATCKADTATPYDACMHAKGWNKLNYDEPIAARAPAQQAAPEASVAATPAEAASPTVSAPSPKMAAKPAENLTSSTATPDGPAHVQAWIHAGGGDVYAAIEACVKTLGESHRPNKTDHTVTQQFLRCMKGSGWYGV